MDDGGRGVGGEKEHVLESGNEDNEVEVVKRDCQDQ